MKKTLSILLIFISFNALAQDSTKVYNLPMQARLIEFLTPTMANIYNDSLYTTFLDVRQKFRANRPLGAATIIIDSIPTFELAALYNQTLTNSDGMGVSNIMKAQIATARTTNSYLNRLCTEHETMWQGRLIMMRQMGRRLLLGK